MEFTILPVRLISNQAYDIHLVEIQAKKSHKLILKEGPKTYLYLQLT